MEYEVYERTTDQRQMARAKAAHQMWQQTVVNQFETAIQDVTQRLKALEALASEEQERSPVRDPNHVAFPTFAKALLNRRDNLRSTLASLTRQLAHARRA